MHIFLWIWSHLQKKSLMENFIFLCSDLRDDTSINSKDIESHSIEMLSVIGQNMLLNILYRAQMGIWILLKTLCKQYFTRLENSGKLFHIAGCFNLNLVNHDTNKKVLDVLMKICKPGMKSTINKPARVTRKTVGVTGLILITCFVNNFFKTATFKTNISDHFPTCILLLLHDIPNLKETTHLYKILNLLTNLTLYFVMS